MTRLLLLTVLLTCLATPVRAGQGLVPATLEWGPNSIDATEELTIEERRAIQQRLKVRRTMMDIHQVFSFAAAGSIIVTEVVGFINDTAFDTGTPVRSELDGTLALHRILVGVSMTTYLGAGIAAWTAPPALRLHNLEVGKGKLDSGVLHVAFSVVHAVAMATVIATGFLQANVAPIGAGWDFLIVTHKVAGFTAAGFVIAAGITIGTL
jgi:hypothetical protein